MNKRILIVEESLRGHEGHWFEYIYNIVNFLNKKGNDVSVLAHKDIIEDFKTSLNVIPVFTKSYYLDQKKPKKPLEKYYGFLLHNISTIKHLWKHLSNEKKYDFIFCPTTTIHHVLAWWFIMKFHRKKPSRLSLLFLTPPGEWNGESVTYGRNGRLLARILKKMRKIKGLDITVQTKRTQYQFEELGVDNIKLLPQPVNLDLTKTPIQKSLNFGLYGYGRYEKGYDLLLNALKKIDLNLFPRLKLIIQWTADFELANGDNCTLPQHLNDNPQVEIIKEPLMPGDYYKYLTRTDCMILPYRNSSYYARDSRIAIESAVIGIPVVFTNGGWLDDHISEYGTGFGFDDENSEDLAKAIIKAYDTLIHDQKIDTENLEKARKYYSIEYFCNLLIED